MRWILVLMGIVGIALQLPTSAPAADGPLVSHRIGNRTYQLFVPPGSGPRPLVIALHGGGGNGAQVAKSAGLIDKAAKEGFILALPEGSSRFGKLETWNAGGCCAYAMREKVDDIGFIRSMIDELDRTQPVDPKRVYVVGMSNGGMMAERVAIELGDRIAGAAIFVGALFGNEPRPVAAVPMLIVNAEKDEQVPVAGGTSTTGIVRRSQGMPYKPSRYAATYWAAANRCTKGPVRIETRFCSRAMVWLRRWCGCRLLHHEGRRTWLAGTRSGKAGGYPQHRQDRRYRVDVGVLRRAPALTDRRDSGDAERQRTHHLALDRLVEARADQPVGTPDHGRGDRRAAIETERQRFALLGFDTA
jgi:polyhydroxybutyrate depolymerase